MITKRKIYNLLIFLILVCFGFFGSLSHIFSLILIIIVLSNQIKKVDPLSMDYKSIGLFAALTGCFFLFLVNSFFHKNFGSSMIYLSPMYPLPLIGLLIIFNTDNNLKLKSKTIAHFSQFSVLFSLLIYLGLWSFFGTESNYNKFFTGRLILFSGNPIPLSFSILGISILCLADWRNSGKKQKISALMCFIIGIYISAFLTKTNSTLLSAIIVSPIILSYLSKRPILILTITCATLFVFLSFIYFKITNNPKSVNFSLVNNSMSIQQRIDMWIAALYVISDIPLFGYNITERFNAVRPYLPEYFLRTYTHPHNDILASIIACGFPGGIASIISLLTTTLAAFLSDEKSSEKLYFGVLLTIPIFITANVSTVFFNDITAAWLAFSTYLIWNTNFKTIENGV